MIVGLAFASNALVNFLVGLLVAKLLGPAEFGRFAIAWAAAVLVNTAGFDWLRLSGVRFYSTRARLESPAIRATLDVCFAAVAALVGLGALALALSGLDLGLSPGLLALAAIAGLTSGLFDYRTALARARFLDRAYIRIVLVKNALNLVLTIGGAYLFGSAKIALAGAALSGGAAFLASARSLYDSDAGFPQARMDQAKRFFAYAAPFILSSVLLQLVPLANRLTLSWRFGYAEAGYFSLANDIGIRILAAIASAMDVFLFQLAVRADEHDGPSGARSRLADNMTIVVAVVLPVAAGLWAVTPSLEALIAPEAFRGPFGYYFAASLPGLAAFALLMYAVAPVFQIAKRTSPMIAAGLGACLVDALLIAGSSAAGQAGVALAYAQTAALTAGLVMAVVFAMRADALWPSARDLAAIVFACVAMIAALLPLRALDPGLATLAAETALGALVYGALVYLFDVAGVRARLSIRSLARQAGVG
jgi:O-antigen/teichoic acid export membrane protein